MGRRAFRRNDVIDQQSRPQTKPIPAATRNVHLDNATSGATFTRTVQPSPGQDTPILSRPLEDCEGCPALAGVRNLGRDGPSAGCSDLHRNFGVRSSRAASSGLQRAEPGPSSGGVPASPFVGPNSRRLRSAWHVVAIMRRRRRVHGWRLKLRVRRLPKRRAEGRQPDRP